jgi:GT2 family glycosyltransferase
MNVDISIIIVNYNVQYFIEQCLNSIYGISDFDGKFEVIVVDNDSSDGSINLIKEKFEQVHLIENSENVGFSVANNQGIDIAKGKYVLLLNPDTIVEEHTLAKCFTEMESDTKIGALGVKMVDGAGLFLPESKRGFPSPMASFYRFTGIYKLFPKSPKVNAYYQGQIAVDEKAEVDILCGAFMFIRKKVLDQIGYLDEAFFMYGEDIDLSYRISQAGFKVLYFPDTTIIHFKGESTRKDSIKYTRRFYQAMDIFARKHFKDSKASVFLKYLSIVIYLKAGINLLKTSIEKALLPLVDTILIFSGLQMIAMFWAIFYFDNVNYYQNAPLKFNFVIYTVIWIVSIFYGGGYDKKVNAFKLLRNIVIGTVVILAVYGLLDPLYRSSRAIIFLSTASTIVVTLISRLIARYFGQLRFDGISDRKNLLIIANESEASNIEDVLNQSNSEFNQISSMPVDISVYELEEIISMKSIDEVICNIRDVGMKRVIELMSALGSKVAFKITGDESLGIIGSQSKNKSGEIYTIQVNYAIQDQNKMRVKRTFDIVATVLSVVCSPLLILLRSTRSIIKNAFGIFKGNKTIIGYDKSESEKHRLPSVGIPVVKLVNDAAVDYARNYTVWKDFRYLWKSLSKRNG